MRAVSPRSKATRHFFVKRTNLGKDAAWICAAILIPLASINGTSNDNCLASTNYVVGASAVVISQEVPTSKLIQQLKSDDTQERRDAAYELAQRGLSAKEALPHLITALQDRDAQVVAFSMQALSRFGPKAESAIQPLASALEQNNLQTVYRAAHALGMIGSAAIPELTDRLEHRKETTRAGAALALRWMGPAALPAKQALLNRLADESDLVAAQAAESLSYLGPEIEPDLANLLAGSTETDARSARFALLTLTRLSAAQEATHQQLRRLTTVEDQELRELALIACREAELSEQVQVEIAMNALSDSSEKVRFEAVESLVRLGDAVKEAMPQLLAQLQSGDAEKRAAASTALSQLGPQAAPLLDEITLLIQTDSEQAADLLPILSGMGAASIPQLLKLIETEHLSLESASETIAAMGFPALDELNKQLGHPNVNCRVAIFKSLGEIVPLTAETQVALEQGLSDSDAQVKRAAIAACASHEGLSDELVDQLFDSIQISSDATNSPLDDEDIPTQVQLLETLVELRGNDARSLSILRNALDSEAAAIRSSAVTSVRRIENFELIKEPNAAELIADKSALVRQAFAEILAEHPSKNQAFQWLKLLLQDSTVDVKVSAVESLAALRKTDSSSLESTESLLNSSQGEMLVRTINAVAQLRTNAEPLLPTLLGKCEHPDTEVRKAAGAAVSEVTRKGSDVVPVLTRMLDDPDWVVRNIACASLAKFENEAVDAVPRLVQLLHQEQDQEAARSAIRSIDAANADAVPALIEALKIEDGRIQFIVVYIIGKVGPEAADAIPALEKLNADSNSRYGKFINETIEKIKGKDD